MDEILIYQGDCLEVMKTLPSESIDSIVTDPPYELGFMGKGWDNTGISNSVELWTECLRVLKSGGYLLSFSGTRTYHRMTCAIEDAGFEIRDMIEWVYGSGFPKSLNIGKAVDKIQGNEREDLGENPYNKLRGSGTSELGKLLNPMQGKSNISKGTSEWEGWGTALKPAHEPICMARKPLAEKTVAQNVLKYGTGGINIDESRVEYQGDADRASAMPGSTPPTEIGTGNITVLTGIRKPHDLNTGRFPANLIHDNSEEVRECFPETKSPASYVRKSSGYSTGNSGIKTIGEAAGKESLNFGDSGNASRFFKSIIYQAKATKSGRGEGNNHPTVKPVALMEYLINMVTPKGGVVLDPFAGSGSTLVAAKELGFNFIGIEKENEYIKIIQARINNTQFYNETLFQECK